jgi:hypothetical protein
MSTYQLAVYDAAYLDLAQRRIFVLGCADGPLRKTARRASRTPGSGPEVVPPLRDAVRFVHDEARHRHRLQQAPEDRPPSAVS